MIGTNSGGIPFAVENEKSGLIIRREAPTKLADVLERVARDQQILEAMGRHGHQECHKRFNWASLTRDLAKAIDKTVDR